MNFCTLCTQHGETSAIIHQVIPQTSHSVGQTKRCLWPSTEHKRVCAFSAAETSLISLCSLMSFTSPLFPFLLIILFHYFKSLPSLPPR